MASSEGSGSSASDHSGGQVEGGLRIVLVTYMIGYMKTGSQIRKFRPDPFHVGTKANFDVLEASLLESLELLVDIMNRVHTERGSSNPKSEAAKVDGHL